MEDKTFVLSLICILGMIGLAAAGYLWPLGDGQSFAARTIEVSQSSLKDVLFVLVGVKGVTSGLARANQPTEPEPNGKRSVTPSGGSVGA